MSLQDVKKDGRSAGAIEALLGKFHFKQFERLGELTDLNKAIEHMSLGIDSTLDGDPELSDWLGHLGLFYGERFQRLGKIDDLEKGMECEFRSLGFTHDDHPDLPNRLSNLGASHRIRFQCQGGLDDLEKAIGYETRAIALIPDSHPSLSNMLSNLGLYYTERFDSLGELDDLGKAIEFESRAFASTPSDHPEWPVRLGNLGASYGLRFQCQGELNDLEQAIERITRAVDLTPDGHPALQMWVVNLAMLHSSRFEYFGEADDLERSIQYQTRAITLTHGDDPNLPKHLCNLGMAYMDRFEGRGELGDLEKAIDCESRALLLTPDNHSSLPKRFSNLGLFHGERFKRLGNLDDLDKAIEFESRALVLTPSNHSDLQVRLGNLGASYGIRFRRLGEIDDLEKAIECESRALILTPDRHAYLADRLGNLGASYRDQFQHSNKLEDIEKSIEHGTGAVSLTADDDPNLPIWIDNLAVAYRDRFESLGELADLEKAIEHMTKSVVITSDSHPALSGRLIHLGTSYRELFERQLRREDLEKAIELQSRALELTPHDHPDLHLRCHNLAVSHFVRFEHTNDHSHFQGSLNCIRQASRALTGAPRTMFWAAFHWAKLVTKHSSLQATWIEAYKATITLLPQFIWLGATTNQRYHDLNWAKNVAVNAAYAAICCSEFRLAIEWLEHARCVVWNQSLMLRTPLDELESTHPTLASRLKIVSNQLHHAGSESRGHLGVSPDEISLEQAAQQHRRLAQEYNDLLNQTRTLPGFEDFLRPTKVNNLIHAARYGPIVVVNCHEMRCDGLMIIPGQNDVVHISLPNFTLDKAQRARSEIETAARSQRLGERGKRRPFMETESSFGCMLSMLWHSIVKPVLDYLGYTTLSQTRVLKGTLPHITWCPTGALTFLPLHAAGDYAQPGSRVFDYVVSSYIPTLAALLTSTPSSLSCDSRVLAIGQEATPGHTKLPGTIRELSRVQTHVQNQARYTQLVNEQATTTAVLNAMEEHDWVHLACHAHQNVTDATKSGFFVHDGTLDLAAISRRSFKDKGLAFLSACQTATGDENLPDEAVHLASGMLMAGYNSVIATMWSVHDVDAPVVADMVYAQLMQTGKIGNGEAGKALHNTVAELRAKVGEKEFGRWVPFIHIGS